MPNLLDMQRAIRGALAPTAVVLAAIAASSCYTSPDPARLKVATSPRGIDAHFRLTDGSRGKTELLAVTDTGFVVLRDQRIVFIRYNRISTASFETVGVVRTGRETPDDKVRSHLTYLSRYPFGLPESTLASLLQGAGQQTPDTIGARRK